MRRIHKVKHAPPYLQQRSRGPEQLSKKYSSGGRKGQRDASRGDGQQRHAAVAPILELLHARVSLFAGRLPIDTNAFLTTLGQSTGEAFHHRTVVAENQQLDQ